MAEIDEYWEIAEAALAEARAMPWGPERLIALKKVGLLRNEAALKDIALGQFRKIWPDSK